MALSETKICSMSLARIGATRLNDLGADTSPSAIHCRTHYEQTRDALLRSHFWRFASARAELSQDTTDPDFEWDNQFILPSDFMRFKSVYEENGTESRNNRHAIEGRRFLTNDSAVSIRYVKRITDVTEFDSLFVEVLALQLALKLVYPLAGTGAAGRGLKQEIKDELFGSPGRPGVMARVRAMDKNETDVGGRSDWNLARHSGAGINSQPERFL